MRVSHTSNTARSRRKAKKRQSLLKLCLSLAFAAILCVGVYAAVSTALSHTGKIPVDSSSSSIASAPILSKDSDTGAEKAKDSGKTFDLTAILGRAAVTEKEPLPNSDEKLIALTFDDGPTPGITEWILAMLEKYDAKATFFVLGKNVEAYPDLFRRIVDAGHKVGNHTYSHQKGWGMSLERYIEDVDFANDLIHSELFRPPYARITPAQARALSQRYKLVMWDVLSRDYSRSLSPRKCLKNVTKHLEPGAIVVFHDSEKSFRNMRYALPRTLDKIRKLGLKCKTIEL